MILPEVKLLIDLEMPECAMLAGEKMYLNEEQAEYLYPMLRVVFFCGYLKAKHEAETGTLGALEREIAATGLHEAVEA